MVTPAINVEEVPGGLFTAEHWMKIAGDLLKGLIYAAREEEGRWQGCVKPQTRDWANEYLAYTEKQRRIAKERALSKLTYDDKVALGLEK